MSPEWRSFETGNRVIRVRTLDSGDFLVNIVSAGVLMAITLPPMAVEHLFPARAPERAA